MSPLRQLRFAPTVLVYYTNSVTLCSYIIIFSEDFNYSFTPSAAGSDYSPAVETLTFGTGPQCFTVQTINDGINEFTECFIVNLFGTQPGLTLNPATTTVCILDNDRTFSSQTGIHN